MPGVLRPFLGQLRIIELAGIAKQSMTKGRLSSLADLPVTIARTGRPHSELVINTPGGGKTGVFRMVKDRDVSPVVSSSYLHTDIHPDGALSLGSAVGLAGAVEDPAVDPSLPRHPQEEAAVVVFPNRDVFLCQGAPFEIQHVLPILHLHAPDLGFDHLGLSLRIEHLVHGLPFNRGTIFLENLGRDPAPVVAAGVMKIVSPVNTGEAPIESCLVLVVTRAVFCQDALSIWRHDRMKVGSEIRLGHLGKDRLLLSFSKNRDRIPRPILSHLELSGQKGKGYG